RFVQLLHGLLASSRGQLLPGLLQGRGERIGPCREGRFFRGRARRVGGLHLLGSLLLRLRQFLRFGSQVRESALERRATEQFLAPLQCLAHLLLGLRQILQRLLGPLGIQILERLLQLGELLFQLGRQRTIQLLPDFLQALLPLRIGESGGLSALFQRFDAPFPLFDLLLQLFLRGCYSLGSLRRLEGQRLVGAAGLGVVGLVAGTFLG